MIIPLNMKTIDGFKKAAYLVTGTWSSRAFNESKKFIESENLLEYFYQNKQIIEYNKLPANFSIPSGIDYVYLCSKTKYKNMMNLKLHSCYQIILTFQECNQIMKVKGSQML